MSLRAMEPPPRRVLPGNPTKLPEPSRSSPHGLIKLGEVRFHPISQWNGIVVKTSRIKQFHEGIFPQLLVTERLRIQVKQ